MDINGMKNYLEGLSIPDWLRLLNTCNKSKCELCSCHINFGCNKTEMEKLNSEMENSESEENLTEEKPTIESLEDLKEAIEKLDWNIYEDEEGYEISQESPAGEDFSFYIRHGNSVKNAIREIQEYAYGFDTEEHIEMWVEAKKNNVSGVPSIRELVEDADAIQAMLENLINTINCDYVVNVEEE